MITKPVRNFCTYLDSHYLTRGLCLHQSLQRHCPYFRLWVLCMDNESFHALKMMNLPGIEPICLEDFERGDQQLAEAKKGRTRIEYYFTCSPSLPLYVLKHHLDVDLITYLDADLFFFSSPEPLFQEMEGKSVGIIEHRLSDHLQESIRHGIYNVGWLTFRRDKFGMECLNWWRDRCNEWCFDRCEEGKYADQKYLDEFPRRFSGVAVLQHKGANVAPWNASNYHFSSRGNTIFVDEAPLIFYHFHGLKHLYRWLFKTNLATYRVKASKVLYGQVYAPYIKMIIHQGRLVSPHLKSGNLTGGIRAGSSWANKISLHPRLLWMPIIKAIRGIRQLLLDDYFVAWGWLQGWLPRMGPPSP